MPELSVVDTATGLFMGNANIRPLSLTVFGQPVSWTLKKYKRILLKHRIDNDVQTDLTLHEDSVVD